jgi:hypothetical protein
MRERIMPWFTSPRFSIRYFPVKKAGEADPASWTGVFPVLPARENSGGKDPEREGSSSGLITGPAALSSWH